MPNSDRATTEVALFGAGCFWGVEEAFAAIPGVIETEVGYAGGTVPDVTYEMVCSGQTGHTEVVRVVFDPSQVTFAALVDAFWGLHDPTTPNRQGPDVGTQYRSAIYTTTEAQATVAIAARTAVDASGRFRAPISTEIAPTGAYFRGEDYHQKYLEKRGLRHCH